MNDFPSGICDDKWRAIPRQPNSDSFYLHCTGGFRAAKVESECFAIEPIYENGEARTKGFINNRQLGQIIKMGDYQLIGFQSCSWIDGRWNSSWHPVLLSQKSSFLSPAGIWSNISSNIRRDTRGEMIRDLRRPDYAKIAKILDDHSTEERLAQAISLSLRSMDFAIEQIAYFYHEQLVNILYQGNMKGKRFSTTMDQALYSHVQAFFLQIGAARDYLAAFIANRLGMDASHGKVDTLNALKNKLKDDLIGKEPLLDLLVKRKFLQKNPTKSGKWETTGWLKEITDLRNEIVHRRPYGLVHSESCGWVEPTKQDYGLYRYFRPIEVNQKTNLDLLDFLCSHYHTCCDLFFEAANASRLDMSILRLTDSDIDSRSVRIVPGQD